MIIQSTKWIKLALNLVFYMQQNLFFFDTKIAVSNINWVQ